MLDAQDFDDGLLERGEGGGGASSVAGVEAGDVVQFVEGLGDAADDWGRR
jgi:hypothetical protein